MKKKAAQASAGQAAARSGDTVETSGQQSGGGIQVLLAAILAALAAFGKKASEKLRQKHKGNDGRSQTPEESAPILGGCRLGLASEPEEQEETGGSRIALLILLASLTSLALWASDYSGCVTLRTEYCGQFYTRCRSENSLDGHWQSTRITGLGGTYYQACASVDQYDYMGKEECDGYPGTCSYNVLFEMFDVPRCQDEDGPVDSFTVTHTRNVLIGTSLSGEDCTWDGPW